MRGGVLACALLLAGSSARAEITVTILSPPSGAVRDQARSFPVIARVESALFPSSVRAQILTRAIDLSYDGTGTLWRADFDAADLPAGTTTLTVSATAPGDSGMAEQTFVLDPKRSIKLSISGETIAGERVIMVSPLGRKETKVEVVWSLHLQGVPGFVDGIVKGQISKITEEALKKTAEAAEHAAEGRDRLKESSP